MFGGSIESEAACPEDRFPAVLDGEVAVPCNPQSATAGSMPARGLIFLELWWSYGAMKVGSRATFPCEPRQDREVAAVSKLERVPRGFPAGATGAMQGPVRRSEAGAQPGFDCRREGA